MSWDYHRLWARHRAVPTGEHDNRSIGQRAADRMKAALATWSALGAVMLGIAAWIVSGGLHGADPFPFILLNLCLSCFAALQCFVLLIANKRGEQIAAQIAVHTQDNTDRLISLLDENTRLTQAVEELTRAVHEHVVGTATDGPEVTTR